MTVRISGEGPLEAALALAAVTKRPFAWEGFRKQARGPVGFGDEEALAIRLFSEICGASGSGGAAGETDLEFTPGDSRAGAYRVELGGEARALALLRAAAVPLALAAGDSEIVVLGSSHGFSGDTFDVASSTWTHLMRKLGVDLELRLERIGFAPRAGGEIRLLLRGRPGPLAALDLGRRGPLGALQIVSAASSLPAHVHQRQAARARSGVAISGVEPAVQLLKLTARGSGSTVAITGVFGGLPLTVAEIAERGQSAEAVGERAASEFRLLFTSNAVLPSCLLGSLLIAAAAAEGRSHLTTARLPRNVLELANLFRSFTGRDVRVAGKPGLPGAVVVEGPKLQ